MKEILMFTMASCPYCKKAHIWMDEILEKNPQYRQLPLTVIDEVQCPDIAGRYDYWFVPTFYIDGVKVHEGAAEKETIMMVFEQAAR